MLKPKQMAIAVALAFPMLAHAQSNSELKNEIDQLKAEIRELRALVKQQAQPQAVAPAASETVDPAEFYQIRSKVEDQIDDKETAGFKGLRISAGVDPTYVYNRAKGTGSFAFLNNNASINGSGEVFSYDNSTWGLAYIDLQKEMEGGTKLRMTLAPSKSASSAFNYGNIVHEAYASIPLSDAQTRLMVGQFADVSGYQPWLNSFGGANSISKNQLYPGYSEFFVTKNVLFDFTNPYFYTGVGLDLVRGPWEGKLFLANFNSARNDVNLCPAATPGAGNVACPGNTRNIHPTLIYNATYAKEEFWGFEFTGYEGLVANPAAGGNSRLDQFEIDANYTRAEFSGNLQFTAGRQKEAAYNGGNAQWWGISAMASQRVLPRLTLAARLDFLNNHKNGGGTFATAVAIPSPLDTALGYVGDYYNGFGPGDPNAAGYDPNKGANHSALSLSATYRYTQNVAFRGEVRFDHATTPSFYFYNDQSFRRSNQVIGMQAVVNY